MHGCTHALADMKDGVGGGMIVPVPWLKSIAESQERLHRSFGEHSMGPVQKLRHWENVNAQLVKGCHRHLNCS